MQVSAELSDGEIQVLNVRQTGDRLAKFMVVDDEAAKLKRVYTESPTDLYQTMLKVTRTEYVNEILLFDGKTEQHRLTQARLEELADNEVSDL